MTFFGQIILSVPPTRLFPYKHLRRMQAKKAAKPKKVVHRLDSDAHDISMDDDSGDSDFGAPKKVPICPSVGVDLVTCQLFTYIAGRLQHRLGQKRTSS